MRKLATVASFFYPMGNDEARLYTQSERLAKYNRLLAIEAETGWPVVAWPSY